MTPSRGLLLALASLLVVALVAAVVALRPAAPGAADPAAGTGVENDELVVATLDAAGLPVRSTLVSRLTTRGGPVRIVADPASTVNVRYRDRRGAPATATDAVLVQVGGPGVRSVLTEADFARPLPLAVHFEYLLDGQTIAPQDVPGAAGELEVVTTVTNTTAQRQQLRYRDAAGRQRARAVPVFVPFGGTLTVTVPAGMTVVEPAVAHREDTAPADRVDAGLTEPEDTAPADREDAGPAGREDTAPADRSTQPSLSTDDGGRTVLRFALLLAPPLGDFQQTVRYRVTTDAASLPAAVVELAPTTSQTDPASGAAATGIDGAVAGNARLADGLEELDAAAGALASGAERLADGGDELAAGAGRLDAEVSGRLQPGADELAAGAAALADGQRALADALRQAAGASTGSDDLRRLADGSAALADALGRLEAGLAELAGPDGLPAAASAARRLTRGANQLADVVGGPGDPVWPPPGACDWTLEDLPELPPDALPPDLFPPERLPGLDEVRAAVDRLLAQLPPGALPPCLPGIGDPTDVPPPTLVQAVRALRDATALLAQAGGALLVTTGEQLADTAELVVRTEEARQAAQRAADGVAGLQAELCDGVTATLTPPQCAALAQVSDDAATAAASSAAARTLAGEVAAREVQQGGLTLLVTLGVLGVEATLGELESAAEHVGVGLRSGDPRQPGLVEGLAALEAGLGEATAGARRLSDGAAVAADGADQVADGVAGLVGGVGELTDGVARAADGADELASGGARLASGADGVAAGVAATEDGIRAVAEAAGALARGQQAVAGGARELRAEGIGTLTASVVAASAEPALAAAWLAATQRRAGVDALPYGPPEGGVGTARYQLTIPGGPAVDRSWLWWLVGAVTLVAAGVAAARRLRG